MRVLISSGLAGVIQTLTFRTIDNNVIIPRHLGPKQYERKIKKKKLRLESKYAETISSLGPFPHFLRHFRGLLVLRDNWRFEFLSNSKAREEKTGFTRPRVKMIHVWAGFIPSAPQLVRGPGRSYGPFFAVVLIFTTLGSRQPVIADLRESVLSDPAAFGWSDSVPRPRDSDQIAKRTEPIAQSSDVHPRYILWAISRGPPRFFILKSGFYAARISPYRLAGARLC